MCKCVRRFYEDENKLVFFDDENYVIYRPENWKNIYKVNLLRIDNEIPATKLTKNQSIRIMDEIRNYSFNYKGAKINGMVGLAITFNNMKNEDVDWLIDIEEEDHNIHDEIENLELENPKNFIELNTDKFLVYKIKENYHGNVLSIPANEFTRKNCTIELSKIKLSTI
ncbi:hypothetical protein ALNOE001_11580 [Candidatus Methanobinarius endosymbioticus]|uniref:Uncharacterized protein n=1 Tax=Candidatus Methanobinarius endosymbioticus TaxID=2006182 RepID=A0A366MBY3_9EURY|nr:hypothetical protein ALNOE001_11580 [Candidatus Methanobinarius endosymbioticus]